jgi:hypothetical protein
LAKKSAIKIAGVSGKKRKAPSTAFKPGNPYAWKKGQSGNPAGYTKSAAETAAYIAQRLREEFTDQLIDAIKFHALKGASPYMAEAVNRMAGKVSDKLELTGADGAPVSVEVHERRSKSFGDYVDRIAAKNKGEGNGDV